MTRIQLAAAVALGEVDTYTLGLGRVKLKDVPVPCLDWDRLRLCCLRVFRFPGSNFAKSLRPVGLRRSFSGCFGGSWLGPVVEPGLVHQVTIWLNQTKPRKRGKSLSSSRGGGFGVALKVLEFPFLWLGVALA